MPEFHSNQMNTHVQTSGINAPDACEVFEWMSLVENQFSRFLEDSELSHVNRRAGQITLVSQKFAELLFEALRFYSETSGIFNPFLGQLMCEIGYDCSFEKINHQHEHRDKEENLAQSANTSFTFDLDQRSVTLSSDSMLDFGGIAKGWAVQKAALNLIDHGRPRGLVNAGGDIMCWNDTHDRTPWVIGVSHPYKDDQIIGQLAFHIGRWGVATSSKTKRSWRDGGITLHHLIDPRNGSPSDSDIIQATVIGPALLPCEIYAKCLLILGSQDGPAWLRAIQPDCAYLFIMEDGQLIMSSNLNDYIHEQFPKKIILSAQ
ncbi:FAD:protein FMN transferase [Sporolactobacillus laevolacticus]|uniref:FAD:protein FMN transferase n=1 Tax=Sporolactobacillus laevolacticus TaxID=33018 RepID=UPI0025B322A7|nr:FAD:protein FMN transferase [Sporolactobacillus laevolacticus]MDN3955113.1 FAD:protein FMN transferase [Sporolactobacillus laevolacticus]